jgi:hypothetical protein
VEEHQRLTPVKDFASLVEQILPSDAKVERAVPRQDVKAQNAASMAALEAMLGKVQGAPTKRKQPRRTR